MNRHEYSGQAVLVTGASSGIGRATALAFAARGASLALASRRESALAAAAAEIQALGSQALVLPTDLSVAGQAQAMVERTVERFGQIDILVSSHGVYVHGSHDEVSIADLEEALLVNFYGAVHAITAALPHMRRRRQGVIVAISSMIAKKALPKDIPYVVSKYALSGYCDALRQELNGSGVHVGIVYPARVDTPFIADIDLSWIARPDPPEAVARAVLKIVRRRKAEIVMPLKSNLLYYLNVLSPALGDWSVRLLRLESRKKGEKQAVSQG